MAFTGFPREGIRFFHELAMRQDREWFKENKAEYVRLWEQPMKELLADVSGALSKQYRRWKLSPPKVMRIYRDVRFSKDKSPFKTHVAGTISFPGGDEAGAPAALYLHLGREEIVAAGHWMLPTDRLKRFRALVNDEKTGRELEKRVVALEKRGFQVTGFEALKRVPPPYDKEHPRARFLKLKGLGLAAPKVPTAVRNSPKLAKWVVEQSAQLAPVVGWLEERLS
ncbi:MAG: DUF2461 domain-containing protein [Archangiaceae bacterium]|nr:DUF2461 domain-containing protein [Archangiaceae bacterium]